MDLLNQISTSFSNFMSGVGGAAADPEEDKNPDYDPNAFEEAQKNYEPVTTEEQDNKVMLLFKLTELHHLQKSIAKGEKSIFAQEAKVTGLKYSPDEQTKYGVEHAILQKMKKGLETQKQALRDGKAHFAFLTQESEQWAPQKPEQAAAPEIVVQEEPLVAVRDLTTGPAPPPEFEYVRTDNWGYLGHLTDSQEAALQAMRDKKFECEESRAGDIVIDDAMLLRFLRARKFDVKKADKMLSEHLVWRDKYLPSRITAEDVKSVLGSGMASFGPYTKAGLHMILIKVGNFDPAQFKNLELFVKFAAFMFERGIQKMPKGAEKATMIFDLKGFTLGKHANPFAMKCIKELVGIIQAHNPERLELLILFNAPFVFSGVWNVIKPLLDPVVAHKIKFISDKRKVLDIVEPEGLPIEYGGTRTAPYPIEGLDEVQ